MLLTLLSSIQIELRTKMQTHVGQEFRECSQKNLELIAPVFFELSCKQSKCYVHTHTLMYVCMYGTACHYIPRLAYWQWGIIYLFTAHTPFLTSKQHCQSTEGPKVYTTASGSNIPPACTYIYMYFMPQIVNRSEFTWKTRSFLSALASTSSTAATLHSAMSPFGFPTPSWKNKKLQHVQHLQSMCPTPSQLEGTHRV